MDSSPASSPVKSNSPPLSPARMSSPTVLSSPDCPSPTLCNSSQRSGSSITMNTDLHASYLSLSEDGKPTPSEAKESTFVTHDKTSKSRTSRKHFPYPPNPAPLELRYAARMMKSKFQPEFSLEATQKFQEQLESGLSQMMTATLYKGYKAKLASREVARQQHGVGDAELEDDRKYLQAVFEDECEILRVASAQTDQVATLLNSRVKHAFLKPAAAFPLHP
ncbi:hypothetical protein DEU56DRAFT_918743 [Suillus clintonianus]|uniref:uncharacterized protein n=1 Tax=Suillus clintonianus TaxID=1904413 RepID=UPI001B881990|nr:uncharacterized protein DEU56DRAFT_918743 [Suillus clintonianus]KAG2118644.1 hypothetical protein DEU56DRAFT_918743 [Suillus clintonianus]